MAADVAPRLRKGTEFNAKSSLSTPQHIRKYEVLTVRIPVMPRSGIRQAVQEPLRDIRQEGAWIVIRTVMRRRNGGSLRPMSL